VPSAGRDIFTIDALEVLIVSGIFIDKIWRTGSVMAGFGEDGLEDNRQDSTLAWVAEAVKLTKMANPKYLKKPEYPWERPIVDGKFVTSNVWCTLVGEAFFSKSSLLFMQADIITALCVGVAPSKLAHDGKLSMVCMELRKRCSGRRFCITDKDDRGFAPGGDPSGR
jgi:hypothetical protein